MFYYTQTHFSESNFESGGSEQALPQQNTVQISDEDWYMPEDEEIRISHKTSRYFDPYPDDE
jgi:hypothetical protein